MYDNNLQHYYLRARYYSPATGRFNRSDPFAGNNRDPQSLHKYLYAHCNPVNGTDPTGQFTLVGMLQSMVISSILSNMVMPKLAPYIAKAASFFLPRTLVQKLLSAALPTVGVAGLGGAITFGLGKVTAFMGGGLVAARELMWSLNDWSKSATFDISGLTGGWMGGAGVSLQGGIFGGVLWGVRDSEQYTRGWSNTITLPGSQLLTALKNKIDTVIGQFYTDMFLFPPGTPGSEITAFRNAATQAISHHSIGARLIFNFHFADDFSVFGFTWGAAVSLGRGLLISYSRTKAKQRSPDYTVDF